MLNTFDYFIYKFVIFVFLLFIQVNFMLLSNDQRKDKHHSKHQFNFLSLPVWYHQVINKKLILNYSWPCKFIGSHYDADFNFYCISLSTIFFFFFVDERIEIIGSRLLVTQVTIIAFAKCSTYYFSLYFFLWCAIFFMYIWKQLWYINFVWLLLRGYKIDWCR